MMGPHLLQFHKPQQMQAQGAGNWSNPTVDISYLIVAGGGSGGAALRRHHHLPAPPCGARAALKGFHGRCRHGGRDRAGGSAA